MCYWSAFEMRRFVENERWRPNSRVLLLIRIIIFNGFSKDSTWIFGLLCRQVFLRDAVIADLSHKAQITF